MEHQIEAATVDDSDSILALLPRLAEFDVPKHRAPRELWRGDAKMVEQWASGERDELDVWVALSTQSEESLEESHKKSNKQPHKEQQSRQQQEPLNSNGSKNSNGEKRFDTGTPSVSDTGTPSVSDAEIPSKSDTTVFSGSDTGTPVNSGVKATDAIDGIEVAAAKIYRGNVIGVSIVSYRPELLNGKPSAHLEVMVVDKEVEGQGVASALMEHAQKMAARKGARSMSLHVFAANTNARTFYDKHNFNGELMRYSKPLKMNRIQNFFGKHVASFGVARSIKKLLRGS